MAYPDDTISTLVQAWDNGLDYKTINGVDFAMFDDGIWEINENGNVIDEHAKVNFVCKPRRTWGCFAE
jgi:hypothetical protein